MKQVETQDRLSEIGARWRAAMSAGDYGAAWLQTDQIELPRRVAEERGRFTRQACHLIWNGQPFTNRRVLVRCEHGLGDTLMFARYFPLLGKQAREVTVKAQPMLIPLLEGMTGVDRVVNAWSTELDPPHDVAIECMELAYAFRSTAETLPATCPYLPVERLRARRDFGFNDNRRQVGLVWAASDWDTSRSLAIEDLAPLAVPPGVVFHSLQQGLRRAEIASSPLPLNPLSQRTAQVADAAAAMLALDLVITVDTMAAHLAGALGRPVVTPAARGGLALDPSARAKSLVPDNAHFLGAPGQETGAQSWSASHGRFVVSVDRAEPGASGASVARAFESPASLAARAALRRVLAMFHRRELPRARERAKGRGKESSSRWNSATSTRDVCAA